MRNSLFCAVIVLGGAIYGRGAAAEKSAENQTPNTRSNRETPIVLAVRKTRDSIVTVRVLKAGNRKDTVGTGVIVDERGYIVTNRHVIRTAKTIRVVLADETSLDAEVAFEEPSQDLAVLRIRTDKKLKALRLGPASDLFIGETVIAIGHPFGYVNTVSTGIISAVGREIEMPTGETLTGLIQTNASINPGNSGGPLLNINGELIGINVALRQDAQGIAFALHADTVQKVLTKHLSAMKVSGLTHGMECQEKVQPEGTDRQKVIVREVHDKTPAAAAGLQQGDEIVKLGNFIVTNSFDIERALWDSRPGDKVVVTLNRRGLRLDMAMTLGEGKYTTASTGDTKRPTNSDSKTQPASNRP